MDDLSSVEKQLVVDQVMGDLSLLLNRPWIGWGWPTSLESARVWDLSLWLKKRIAVKILVDLNKALLSSLYIISVVLILMEGGPRDLEGSCTLDLFFYFDWVCV